MLYGHMVRRPTPSGDLCTKEFGIEALIKFQRILEETTTP